MRLIYKATYSYMTKNPGIEMKGSFLVAAKGFEDALKKSRAYLATSVFVPIKELQGVVLVGEVVSR